MGSRYTWLCLFFWFVLQIVLKVFPYVVDIGVFCCLFVVCIYVRLVLITKKSHWPPTYVCCQAHLGASALAIDRQRIYYWYDIIQHDQPAPRPQLHSAHGPAGYYCGTAVVLCAQDCWWRHGSMYGGDCFCLRGYSSTTDMVYLVPGTSTSTHCCIRIRTSRLQT